MKIRLESNNNLPLDNTQNILGMIIVTACILEKNGKYYAQIFLYRCLCKL